MALPLLVANTVVRPRDVAELAEIIAAAAAAGTGLELAGALSKRGLGRPVVAASHVVQLSAFAGIVAYEPDELVLTAGAATPMRQIQALLAQSHQQLAFEPPDLGPLLGGPAEAGTLGGALACNLAGPRRLAAGAARDHFLGFQAVNGRGVPFKAGGRVVKNVTGYDLPKLLAGSFGTLAALTEVTVKVLPRAPDIRTVMLPGLDDARAMAALAQAMGSSHEVSAAAHLPAGTTPTFDHAATLLRLEGPTPSVVARAAALARELDSFGRADPLEAAESERIWRDIGDAAPLVERPELLVWRLSVPPRQGAAAVARIGTTACHWYDWAGGLIWLGLDPAVDPDGDGSAARVRAAVAAAGGGHATLVRAPADLRGRVAVFEPAEPGLAALASRVKASFDPAGILNPGRMYGP